MFYDVSNEDFESNWTQVFEPRKPFVTIPDYSTWNRDPKAAYLFYCSNETVHGLEYHTVSLIINHLDLQKP